MKIKTLLLSTILSTFFSFSQVVIFDEDSVNNSSGLAILNDQVYVAGRFSNSIYKVNLSSMEANPSLILQGIDGPSDIEVSEGYLYITLNSNNSNLDKIIKFDLNETNPIPEDIVSISNPNGLTIYNNKIYVSSGEDIYTVDLSITNPTPILFADNVSFVFGTVGLCIYNNYLYATGNGQLIKYNLNSSNPSKEIVLSNFNGEGLTVKDDKIYSTGDFPTKIFEIDPLNETFTAIAESDITTGWDIITNSNSIFVSNLEGGEVVKYDFSNLSIDNFADKHLSIYPNPSSNTITFSDKFKGSQIIIYDSTGRIVKKVLLEYSNIVNIEDLINGTYIVRIDENRIGKMIKQ